MYTLEFVHATKLIEYENRFMITGKGCGILKPIRFLFQIPLKPENYECSIIMKANNAPKKPSGPIGYLY